MHVEVEITVKVTNEVGKHVATVSLTHDGEAGGNPRFLMPTAREVVDTAGFRALEALPAAVNGHTETVRLVKLP